MFFFDNILEVFSAASLEALQRLFVVIVSPFLQSLMAFSLIGLLVEMPLLIGNVGNRVRFVLIVEEDATLLAA